MHLSPDELFSALANPTRLRCLLLLMKQGELCVCELTQSIKAPQPTMSRHLAQLRDVKLVTDRREGQWIYYRINPDLPPWVSQILEASADGTEGIEPYRSDLNSISTEMARPITSRCP